MKKYIKYTSIGGILLLLFSACNPESGVEETTEFCGRLQIRGEIVGTGTGVTKADKDELGSYIRFLPGDEIGFFSFHENGCSRGSMAEHNGKDDTQYYKNEKLTYTEQNMFVDLDGESDVVYPTLGTTFAYYPYSSSETAPEDYVKSDGKKLQNNECYINIFAEGSENKVVKDILTASAAKLYYNVNYAFRHQFSMLLFSLDEGFSHEQNKEGLTVHLTEKILGAHVTREWGTKANPELLTFEIDRCDLSAAEGKGSSEFVTGKCIDEYTVGGSTKKNVYRVILPYGSKVDYISVNDVNGKPQKVRLPESVLPELKAGWKYPLTIKMDGIVPTVYPHKIEEWGATEEIVVDQLAGIYSLSELREWITLYNDNSKNFWLEREDDESNPFSKYGIKTGEPGSWTFYIRANIDCAEFKNAGGVLINELGDGVTLDGGKYILSNLTLKASATGNAAGIIGKVTDGGIVRNLRLENITVTGGGKGTSAGCIAATIGDGAQVVNCTVKQANMTGDGYVGVLAGTMSGGVALECKFRGMVTAPLYLKGTEEAPDEGGESEVSPMPYKGIVGQLTGGTLENIINQVNFAEVGDVETE